MIWLNWCCYKITLSGNRPQEELDRRRFRSRRFVRDWISNDVSTRQPVHLIPNVSREIELDRVEFRRLDRSREQRKRAGRQNGVDNNSNIKGTFSYFMFFFYMFYTGICYDWTYTLMQFSLLPLIFLGSWKILVLPVLVLLTLFWKL